MTYTTELNAAWMAHRDRWMSFADQGKIRYPNLYAELKAILLVRKRFGSGNEYDSRTGARDFLG